jgi:hypothetical protein
MESLRWLRLAPLAIAVAAGALGPGRPVAGAAPGSAWDPPPCPSADTGGPPGAAAAAWYRLEPVLDAEGTLVSRRLTLGGGAAPARWLDLAPESFASGPARGLVLVGDDDGARSRLRLVDPGRGCAVEIARDGAVIRSAFVAPDGAAVLEHRVDRTSRQDLGVWSRPLDGAPPVQVLDGLRPDPSLGPTFTTDLLVAADGRLVVSSCGLEACRVRVLDPGTGEVATIRGTGPALGVRGDSLIVRAPCPGQPCPVEAVGLATGARTVLMRDAQAAVLGGPGDDRVVATTPAGRVVVVDVASGRRASPAGLTGQPLRRGSTATAGVETPPGAVGIATRARPDGASTRVLDPVTAASTSLKETTR